MKRETQIFEAARCLNRLNVPKKDIDAFLEHGIIPSTCNLKNLDPSVIIRAEQRYSAVIYYAMKSEYEEGILWHFLFVGNHRNEWKDDRWCLDIRCPIAIHYSPKIIWFDHEHMELSGMGITLRNGKVYPCHQ